MTVFARRPPYLLDQLPERAAERAHASPAVVLDGHRLSYGELALASARVATALVQLGVRPGDRVALLARKGAEAVAALYGILRAGAAYVPLDPGAPAIRHFLIVRDAGATVAIGEAALLARLQLVARAESAPSPLEAAIVTNAADADAGAPDGSLPPVARVRLFADLAAEDPAPPHAGTEQDLAYLLYTSGSTGMPKGVMHTHRSALSFALWAADEFALSPDDRVANHAPFHFDLSTFDYFSSAFAGATVYPIPSREAAFPASVAARTERDRHTVVYATPSSWVQMMNRGRLAERDLSALRVALYAGEVFAAGSLARFLALLPRATRCFNLYGPTETNVCTFAAVTRAPDAGEPSDIGRACPNLELFALDDEGRRVGTGGTGELCVRGGSVMLGYWGDPERTARALIRNPGHSHEPDPAYRTGDLVMPQTDGSYRFLGRRDHQVKVRGYRVELGEVESALASHPAVSEAIVVAVPHAEHGSTLVGLVVVARGAAADGRELKRLCAARLPAYMVPEQIEVRERLPRTASGKVDRNALAQQAAAARLSESAMLAQGTR